MTKEDYQNVINLLFTGKWNLSIQEAKQIVEPLINKISQEMAKMEKPEKK